MRNSPGTWAAQLRSAGLVVQRVSRHGRPKQPIVVAKFGGTSVACPERISSVAKRAVSLKNRGFMPVFVVSAMAGETDRLIGLAQAMGGSPCARELDVLLTTGEQVVAALLAIAIEGMGIRARSFLGHQVSIRTDRNHGNAAIRSVDTQLLEASLERGEVPVVAGYQGVDALGNITTLGRGGSDTAAVAVAAALGADACEIFTDVDGVYDQDPRVVPHARKFDVLDYESMYQMAAHGAKVLHDKSVLLAAAHEVPLYVRSTFSTKPGTWVGTPPLNFDSDVGWPQIAEG